MGTSFGKTIIFAKKHDHAEKIVEIFNELYPQYKGEFAQVIDNHVEYREELIEHFSIKQDLPQIAVSVDMLDTGVDIPEILNLVFFKPVKSKVKFWQMIGRGTRPCKNLFGIGQHKKEFYIFDYCKNFEFFSENPKGIESTSQISLTEKIYSRKLELIVELQNMKYQVDENYKNYREELIQELITQIKNLNKESFTVRAVAHYIEHFSQRENWNHIYATDFMDIKDNILPLLIGENEQEEAKRFDNLLYALQIKKIKKESKTKYENSIIEIAQKLEGLGTIPQVVKKQELIVKIAETDYIRQANFWEIEEIRVQLRDFIQLLDQDIWHLPTDTDFADTLTEIDEEEITLSSGNNFTNYKKKLEKYVNGNLDNSIIWKIKHNIVLTQMEKQNLEKILFEELGSNQEYVSAYGNTSVIKTVRNIVGLDPSVAKEIFYKYINENRFNTKQIEFVKLIMEYVIQNGTIEMEKLTKQPFKTLGQVYDLFGNNIADFQKIKKDLEEINQNTEKLA